MRRSGASPVTSRSSTSYSLTPRSCSLSACSRAQCARACWSSRPRQASTRCWSDAVLAGLTQSAFYHASAHYAFSTFVLASYAHACTLILMTDATPLPAPRWNRSVWGLLAVLCGVLFLDGLDVSMVGMALPSIETDLGLTTSQLQWIVSGYVLGYGGFLLLGGRAAHLPGRPPVLLIGLAAFPPASAVGGPVGHGT